jgi:hypothetical protein
MGLGASFFSSRDREARGWPVSPGPRSVRTCLGRDHTEAVNLARGFVWTHFCVMEGCLPPVCPGLGALGRKSGCGGSGCELRGGNKQLSAIASVHLGTPGSESGRRRHVD